MPMSDIPPEPLEGELYLPAFLDNKVINIDGVSVA